MNAFNKSRRTLITVILKGAVLAFLIASISWSSNCFYYSFSGGSLPPHINTVAIPLFEDRTSEYGIKERLTDALIDEFVRDNTLKIADRRSADSVLLGTILNVSDRVETYNRMEQAETFKLYITVEVEYNDLKKNKTMWKERLTQWGRYTVTTGGPEDREKGIDEAIEKLSADILNKTVSGW